MRIVARKTSTITWFAILLLIGVGLALVLPASPTTLHTLGINALTYRLTILSLVLPYAIIWFAAFYAYGKLEQYAQKLENTREGEAFKKIADGVRFLAWGLAITTLLAVVLRGAENWMPSFRPAHIIIDNYAGMLVPLLSFMMIGNGTRLLTEIVRARPSSIGIRILVAIFTTVGVLFSYFVIQNQGSDANAYYLPPVLLLLTIVVPYLFAWLVGLLAAYELRLYSKKTRGVLYQRALVWLAGGLAIVIGGSILSQYLSSVFSGRDHVGLGLLLGAVYLLLIVQTVGYVLIAFGANQLKKIEEV